MSPGRIIQKWKPSNLTLANCDSRLEPRDYEAFRTLLFVKWRRTQEHQICNWTEDNIGQIVDPYSHDRRHWRHCLSRVVINRRQILRESEEQEVTATVCHDDYFKWALHLEGKSEDNFGVRKTTPTLISSSRIQSTTSYPISLIFSRLMTYIYIYIYVVPHR